MKLLYGVHDHFNASKFNNNFVYTLYVIIGVCLNFKLLKCKILLFKFKIKRTQFSGTNKNVNFTQRMKENVTGMAMDAKLQLSGK